jgi:hypothetical protein
MAGEGYPVGVYPSNMTMVDYAPRAPAWLITGGSNPHSAERAWEYVVQSERWNMNERDETDSLISGASQELPASSLNRGTLIGCAGILLVLSFPALLFLPLERLHMPLWLWNLIWLLGLSALALGTYLLIRMPVDARIRSADPGRPLTSSGRSPILEQPAERSNRATLLVEYGLVLCATTGYGMVSFAAQDAEIAIGTLVLSASGYSLLLGGSLAGRRVIPVPAWRWVRLPVQGGLALQALAMMGLGLVLLVWSLILGVEDRYLLLSLGLGLLFLTGTLFLKLIRTL